MWQLQEGNRIACEGPIKNTIIASVFLFYLRALLKHCTRFWEDPLLSSRSFVLFGRLCSKKRQARLTTQHVLKSCSSGTFHWRGQLTQLLCQTLNHWVTEFRKAEYVKSKIIIQKQPWYHPFLVRRVYRRSGYDATSKMAHNDGGFKRYKQWYLNDDTCKVVGTRLKCRW